MAKLHYVLCAILVGSVGTVRGDVAQEPVHVLFLDNFFKEPIEVSLNDKVIYTHDISTATTGLAARIELAVATPQMHITVDVPRLKTSKSIDLDPANGKYLLVGLKHDQLWFHQRPHSVPFY